MIFLNSFLFLSLLGLAASDILNPASGNDGFATSKDLYGIYYQGSKSQHTDGYHKAEIYFKTKVPSVNLDRSGVSNIDCKDGKISFIADNKDAIKQVNKWPNKVMLLVSHKWKCFGKATTQFYMVSNKVVDLPGKKATFTAEECDITDWSERYSVDVTWVDNERTKKRKSHHHGRKYKRADPIDLSKKLNFDVLFDEKTGKSSKPNIPLLKLGQNKTSETLVCANCFVNGEATISLRIAGEFPKLTEAFIGLSGNIKMNLDFALNGKVKAVDSSPEIRILSIPLTPLNIPKVVNIGPSIDLSASAKVSADITGTLFTGGEVSLPNFVANASFVDKPTFQQSGFKPVTTPHDPTVGVSVSADISGSLKPQLAFGIDVLDGTFSVKTGFQVVASLGSSISINSKGDCEKQPRLKSTLDGNLGFFVRSNDFPILEFPSVTLLNKCI